MAYLNKVKSDPATIVDQAIGIKGVNIGVNTNRTYGGSPYTGWYNTFDVLTTVPEGIVMYKANTPAEGTIYPDGGWTHDFSGDEIPLDLERSWTIECWVLFPSSTFDCTITRFNSSGGLFGFGIDTLGRLIFDYNNSNVVTSSPVINAGVWTHVAITREGQPEVVNLYVNGNNVGSASFGVDAITPTSPVTFFGSTNGQPFYCTNLRVVTKTAIYPTESLVSTYPQYPLNRSYDDTVVLILGKKASNFDKDYSLNNVAFTFEGSPYLEAEIPTPLLKIIDATKVSVSPWNTTNIENGLLELINGHPSRFGQPYFTVLEDAVDWTFNVSTDPFMFSNISYEETDGGIPYFKNCKMFLDSGNISSYPIVFDNHYNLRKYDDFGVKSNKSVRYNEQYGGRLWSNRAGNNPWALLYTGIGGTDYSSFIYYGVLGFAETFTTPHDIVGFYGGNNNWRIVRTSATVGRLLITDGGGNEISMGTIDITGTESPTDYFGLLVSYDNSNGDWFVFVNGQDVGHGNNFLNRVNSGSEFRWGNATNVTMYHYTSAVWAKESDFITTALSMGDALSSRYAGIA
jgi:hypothetical protein